MDSYRIRLLGEFQCIDDDGQAVEIKLAKQVALIALLVLGGNQCCSRAKIIDLLWSDRCDDQGRTSLRQALWSLNKKLNRGPRQLLQIDRRRVVLNLAECSVDVLDFTALALSLQQRDMERAVAIYRGELLDNLVVNDREWEAWLEQHRNRLQTIYQECLYRLSRHYRAALDARSLMATGLRLIEHDPLGEEGHRALMEAYALTQRRSQALKQYERYRELILRELGSRPEPSIRRRYEQLRGAPGTGEDPGSIAGTRFHRT
jgi:DNA-binding SARP family transcriptional activator